MRLYFVLQLDALRGLVGFPEFDVDDGKRVGSDEVLQEIVQLAHLAILGPVRGREAYSAAALACVVTKEERAIVQ